VTEAWKTAAGGKRVNEREKESEREGWWKGNTKPYRHIEDGGYNGSASSGALESPDTPSSKRTARTRVSGARSSICRDIAIHTSVGALFTSRETSLTRSERGSNDYKTVCAFLSRLTRTH